MCCLQWILFKIYAGKTTYLNSKRKTWNIILALKKEKPEESKLLPTIPSFFPFHWYIAGSPHPAPKIPLLPQLRNENKLWRSLLTVGDWAAEQSEGADCRAAPPARHIAEPRGGRGMQRVVGSGPGRRVTRPLGAADSRRPQPAYLCLWPQKELGTKPGMKDRKQAEEELLFRKRLTEEKGKVMILCISDVLRYWKMWREHLLIAPRWR